MTVSFLPFLYYVYLTLLLAPPALVAGSWSPTSFAERGAAENSAGNSSLSSSVESPSTEQQSGKDQRHGIPAHRSRLEIIHQHNERSTLRPKRADGTKKIEAGTTIRTRLQQNEADSGSAVDDGTSGKLTVAGDQPEISNHFNAKQTPRKDLRSPSTDEARIASNLKNFREAREIDSPPTGKSGEGHEVGRESRDYNASHEAQSDGNRPGSPATYEATQQRLRRHSTSTPASRAGGSVRGEGEARIEPERQNDNDTDRSSIESGRTNGDVSHSSDDVSRTTRS